MSFNENVQLDTSNVEGGGGGGMGGGGGRGGIVVGGGIGGLILMLILAFLGINPGDVNGGGTTTQGDVTTNASGQDFSQCQTGADANKYVECRIIGTVNSAQAFWEDTLTRAGRQWTPAKVVIYSGAIQSACGTASNQVGPFYCPLDQKIYIDASFYDILEQKFGSSTGALAQEYVVAHEYGHHIENLYGILDRAQDGQTGANSNSVRIELMADCFGGVWAKHASTTPDPKTGVPFLKPLTDQDIKDALSAAKSVGDDSIQEMTTGQQNPEAWTHGSSRARMTWFLQGYKTGDFQTCDTFNVATVE